VLVSQARRLGHISCIKSDAQALPLLSILLYPLVALSQDNLPLISAICNPGLRERHWVALAELVGFEIKRDEVRPLGPFGLAPLHTATIAADSCRGARQVTRLTPAAHVHVPRRHTSM
jgi:hypothetical protein